MSTEIAEIVDCLKPEYSIEVATGTGGIRLFSTVNKIWIDVKGAKLLIKALETAIATEQRFLPRDMVSKIVNRHGQIKE